MAPYNKYNNSPIINKTGHIRAAQTSQDINIQRTLYKNNTIIRVKMPEDFIRNQARLIIFIAQAVLYIVFNIKQFINKTQQVLQVIILLKGVAFNQISLFFIDFIANKALNNIYINNIKKETIIYFYIMAGFKKGI